MKIQVKNKHKKKLSEVFCIIENLQKTKKKIISKINVCSMSSNYYIIIHALLKKKFNKFLKKI